MSRVGSGFFEISRTFGDLDFDATRLKSMPKNLKIIKKSSKIFLENFFLGGQKVTFSVFRIFHQETWIFLDRFFRLKYTSGSPLLDSFSKLIRSASEGVENRG